MTRRNQADYIIRLRTIWARTQDVDVCAREIGLSPRRTRELLAKAGLHGRQGEDRPGVGQNTVSAVTLVRSVATGERFKHRIGE